MLAGLAESCWVAGAPDTDYPALTGKQHFDVAVVGGGIVGLTTAVQLANAGRSVAVIEASRIGRQVTGRSTAKITTQHGFIYRHLIDQLGRGKAELYADANQQGMDWILRAIETHGIDCDLESADAYVYIGPDRARLAEAEAEADAAASLGLPAGMVDRVPLPFATGGALRFSAQAQFNPASYLIQLGAVAERAGVRIFEKSRVKDVKPGERWTVKCTSGEISARDVVMATHIPFVGGDDYTGRTQPRCHVAMAFPIAREHAPVGMFIGADEPTHSIRTGRDGDRTLLVVLGSRFPTGHEGNVVRRFCELEEWAREHFGTGAPAFHWCNEDYETADRVPFAGATTKQGPGFYIATGFNAWGITNGTAAGLLIADQICQRANDWASLYDPTRPSPEDFNKGGESRSLVKTVADIAPGDGGVIEAGTDKLAVWRDEMGDLHTFSAACTHHGCTVTWNGADRTWDCPCHGSVFATDGSVIHGPAVEQLERRELPTAEASVVEPGAP